MQVRWLVFFIVMLPLSLIAQETRDYNGRTYYISFDENPQFPTGDYDMYTFVGNNLALEAIADEEYRIAANGYHSLMRLFIDTTGKITNVELDFRSRDNWLLDEIQRTFYAMPHWNPGRVNGEAVPAVVYVPVEAFYRGGLLEVNYSPVFPDSYFYAREVKRKFSWLGAVVAGVLSAPFIYMFVSALVDASR